MQSAVSQIMIIVLLVHAALGCCWHHAHECVSGCCDLPTAVVTACPCESHQHAERSASHEPLDDGMHSEGDNHHREHDCDGDHCTFVRSDRSPKERGERSIGDTSLSWNASAEEGSPIRAQFPLALDCPALDSGPSLRSHLVLGVLLI